MVYESFRSSRGFSRGNYSPRGRNSYAKPYIRGSRGISFRSERGEYYGSGSSPSRGSKFQDSESSTRESLSYHREHRSSYSRGGGHFAIPRDSRRDGSPYSRNGRGGSSSSYSRSSRHANDEEPPRKRYRDDSGPMNSEGHSSSYKGRTTYGSEKHLSFGREETSRYSGSGAGGASASDREKETYPWNKDREKRTTSSYLIRDSHETSKGGSYGTSSGTYEISRRSYGTSRGSYVASRGSYEASRGSHRASRGSYGASRGSYGAIRGSYRASRGSYAASRGSYGATRGFRSSYRGGRGSTHSYMASKFSSASRVSKYPPGRPTHSSRVVSEHAMHKMKLMEKLRLRNAERGVYSRVKKGEKSGKEEKRKDTADNSPIAEVRGADEDENNEEKEKDKKSQVDKDRNKKKASAKDDDGEFSFIKLRCVHCDVSCRTFRQYEYHLSSLGHRRMLSRVIDNEKRKISRMRMDQRTEQRIVDDEDKDSESHNFCIVCKLHYRQSTYEHFVTDSHLSMAEVMNPRCEICAITFSSPIIYQHHRCSLPHIKRKAFLERKGNTFDDGTEQDNADGEEKFMVLDCVGSADEDSDGDEEVAQDGDRKKVSSKTKIKKSSDVGFEYIKKVNVYYCELCVLCLPYRPSANQEDTLTTHCHGRMHLSKYTAVKKKKEEKSQKAAKVERKAEFADVKIKDEGGDPDEEETDSQERRVKGSLKRKLAESDNSDEYDEEEEEGE